MDTTRTKKTLNVFARHRSTVDSRAAITPACTEAWLIDLRVSDIEIDRLLCRIWCAVLCLNDSRLFFFFPFARFQFSINNGQCRDVRFRWCPSTTNAKTSDFNFIRTSIAVLIMKRLQTPLATELTSTCSNIQWRQLVLKWFQMMRSYPLS